MAIEDGLKTVRGEQLVWQAVVSVFDHPVFFTGFFETKEEAQAAGNNAKAEYDPQWQRHGDNAGLVTVFTQQFKVIEVDEAGRAESLESV